MSDFEQEHRLRALRYVPEFQQVMEALSAFLNATPDPAGHGDGIYGHPSLAQTEDAIPLLVWAWRYCSLGDCCDRCDKICLPIDIHEQYEHGGARFNYHCLNCDYRWQCSWGDMIENQDPLTNAHR